MAKCVDAELLAITYLKAAKEAGVEGLEFLTPEDVARTILHCADSCEEIAPVIHAHWLVRETSGEWGYENEFKWECSNCGCPYTSNNHNYCSQCGAKMDEEVK